MTANIHCHPRSPKMPFMSSTAPASGAPMTLDTTLPMTNQLTAHLR